MTTPMFVEDRWHLISSNSTGYTMQSLLDNMYPSSVIDYQSSKVWYIQNNYWNNEHPYMGQVYNENWNSIHYQSILNPYHAYWIKTNSIHNMYHTNSDFHSLQTFHSSITFNCYDYINVQHNGIQSSSLYINLNSSSIGSEFDQNCLNFARVTYSNSLQYKIQIYNSGTMYIGLSTNSYMSFTFHDGKLTYEV